jgi:hypothetical protein
MSGNAAPPLGSEHARQLGNDAATAGQRLVLEFLRPKRDDARQLPAPLVSGEIWGGAPARVAGGAARASEVRHVGSIV